MVDVLPARRRRTGARPLSERTVALGTATWLRLAVEDQGGVAVYLEAAGARPAEPVLRLPPGALRELARALALLAGELGVQP